MSIASITSDIKYAADPGTKYHLKRILVAHDASPDSELALEDAVAMAKRFQSEIILAYVQPPPEEGADSLENLQIEDKARHAHIEGITKRLVADGLDIRSIIRGGIVGDTLFNIACEEDADLLLLGAYGYGSQDRRTLGCTAEYLLRVLPCAALTYGPNVTHSSFSGSQKGPVLVPVSLPCSPNQLRRAIEIATLLGIRLELLHVVEPANPGAMRTAEHKCELLALQLRGGGLNVQWSVLCGSPDALIRARSSELDSPFILMPLKWRKSLSSITSDNVAAHVIRLSHVPVMTYSLSE